MSDKEFTISEIRQRLAQPQPHKQFWRSLDELADTEAFQKLLAAEFPSQIITSLREATRNTTRRDFLKLMGAALAMERPDTGDVPAGSAGGATDAMADGGDGGGGAACDVSGGGGVGVANAAAAAGEGVAGLRAENSTAATCSTGNSAMRPLPSSTRTTLTSALRNDPSTAWPLRSFTRSADRRAPAATISTAATLAHARCLVFMAGLTRRSAATPKSGDR